MTWTEHLGLKWKEIKGREATLTDQQDSSHVPFFTFYSIRGNNKDILWVTLDQVYISTHNNI